MPAEFLFILLPALASAAVFGALVAFLIFSGRLSRLRNENAKLEISPGGEHVYQVGKRRFARVTIN